MALLGAHITISLICWVLYARLQQYLSLGRRLIAPGLFGYIPPTADEIIRADGIQLRSKKRGSSNRNGVADAAEGKLDGMLVSKDVDVALYKTPVGLDMLTRMEYFDGFVYCVDFALVCLVNFALTEAYYTFIGGSLYSGGTELNLSVIWCLLGALFALLQLLSVVKLYFSLDSGAEKSACLLSGVVGFVVAVAFLLFAKDNYLDFELDASQRAITERLSGIFDELGWSPANEQSTLLMMRFIIAIWCGVIAAAVVFPANRCATMFFSALQSHEQSSSEGNETSSSSARKAAASSVALHVNFIVSLIFCLLWIKPIARDIWERKEHYVSFDAIRFAFLVGGVALRGRVFQTHMQAHLDSPERALGQLRLESGRITVKELQRKVYAPLRSLALVAVQYAAPFILMLLLQCAARGMTRTQGASHVTSSSIANMPIPDEAKRQASLIQAAFLSFFSADLLVPIYNFIAWWTSLCLSVCSILSLVYQRRVQIFS